MKIHYFLFLAALSLKPALFAAELHYKPNKPKTQISEMSLTFSQQLPGIKVEPTLRHRLTAEIAINESGSNAPFTSLPLEIIFTPKSMEFSMESDSLNVSFDTSSPEGPAFLGELAAEMEKPIALTIAADHAIGGEEGRLDTFNIQGSDVSNLPVSWVNALFSLAGEELVEGGTYIRDFPPARTGLQPETLAFSIDTIDNESITATFSGTIPKKEIALKSKLTPQQGKDKQHASYHITGTVAGRVEWLRDNALVFKYSATHLYEGEVKVGTWSWAVTLNAEHIITTKP